METKKILMVGIFLFAGIIVMASTWVDQGSDLSSGMFNDTLFNETGQYIYLNWTDAMNTTYIWNGTYISAVKDFGSTARFLNISWEGKSESCPEGMAYIDKLGGFCIDKYEASMPNANSTHMGNATEVANRNNPGAMPATSKLGVIPWVYISQINSRTACSNAGKHLCTSKEWLAAANIKGKVYNLDATLTECNVVSGQPPECTDHSFYNTTHYLGDACNTGYMSHCISAEGVYDLVGNVWEWCNESLDKVINPQGNETDGTGKVQWYYANASNQWQNTTTGLWSELGEDGVYFPTTVTGVNVRAVLRGGTWNGAGRAGPFCALLHLAPSPTTYDVGFRCCSAPN